MPPPIVVGEAGMTRLLYVGALRGLWKGPCTGERYRVEPGGTYWVDKRDADGLMTVAIDGTTVFEVA